MSDEKRESQSDDLLAGSKGRERRFTVEVSDGEIVEIFEVDEDAAARTPGIAELEACDSTQSTRADLPAVSSDQITARHFVVDIPEPDGAEPLYVRKDPVAWHKLDYREGMLLVPLERPVTRQEAISKSGLDLEAAGALFITLFERGVISQKEGGEDE